MIKRGAYLGLTGFILSGPVAVAIVNMTHPQPPWTSAESFVEHYNFIQNLPYFLGPFLLAGMLLLSAGHYLNYKGEVTGIRSSLFLSVLLTAVFIALVSFNYISQTTFVHTMAMHYRPEFGPLITGFSMSNPMSFCWAIEMWGYGILGIATWLMAPYYNGKNNVIRGLLISNGIISLISPIWTIIDVQWVLSTLGFSLFLFWNFLMMALMIAIIKYSSSKTYH